MTEILDFKTRKRQQPIEEQEKIPTAKDWLILNTTDELDKYNGGILILFNDELELSDIRSLNVMSVDYLWYSEILRQIAMEE